MSEVVKVSQLKVGDTINTAVGYVLKVLEISEYKKPNTFGTPQYMLTVISNIDNNKDDIKEYEIIKNSTDVVLIIDYDWSKITDEFEYNLQL